MNVELLRVTEKSEELIASAYGICQNRDSIPLANISKYIKMGHLSPLEHCSVTFKISGISRTCLSQLTRHRLASYSVLSQRYTRQSAQLCVVPESISGNAPAMEILATMSQTARVAYRNLLALGVPKEDARFCLLLGAETKLIMTINFRQARHMIELRTSREAQWEIRELMKMVCYHLKTVAPNVFRDLWAEIKGYDIEDLSTSRQGKGE